MAANKKVSSSAIVEMDSGEDNSDYEVNFDDGSTTTGSKRAGGSDGARSTHRSNIHDSSEERDLKGDITKGVANYVWEESRARARKAFNVYGNIDILRPYYDVEPREVLNRLASSLIPRVTSSNLPQQTIPRELYGPTMLVFTLIAMLLFEMKSSGHIVQEGTLMGTAIGTCFGYWLGVSGLLWLTAYICNSNVSMLQTLHILGYALFGHCVVILLTTLVHPHHNHLFFYALFLIFGGMSTLRLVIILTSRTQGRSQKMIIACVVLTFHLLFLFYLHFAYHHIVEELSGATSVKDVNLSFKEAGDTGLMNETFKRTEAALNSMTGQAFTKFARKSFQRVLRGGLVSHSGGDDLGRVTITSSSTLQIASNILMTLKNATAVDIAMVARE